MKIDRLRADDFEKEINKNDIAKIEEKIGIYKHIIQTYISLKNYSELEFILNNLSEKFDVEPMIYGGNGKLYIEVQFYPI